MTAHFFVPDWPLPSGLRAAMSLRGGGVSTGCWHSLNLGAHVGDDPASVAENRRLLIESLQLRGEPLWLDQVHGAAVLDAARAAREPARRVGDAIVARGQEVLAIQVADCLPVLFAARDGAVFGAAHAGWRGLAAGVLEATVAALGVEPRQVSAWLGPCIRQGAFEVGAEVRAAFGAPFAQFFAANNEGRWQCDLAGIAAERLRAAGVGSVVDCGLCTYQDAARFFSHRRDAVRLGGSGRMAALLWRVAGAGS